MQPEIACLGFKVNKDAVFFPSKKRLKLLKMPKSPKAYQN